MIPNRQRQPESSAQERGRGRLGNDSHDEIINGELRWLVRAIESLQTELRKGSRAGK